MKQSDLFAIEDTAGAALRGEVLRLAAEAIAPQRMIPKAVTPRQAARGVRTLSEMMDPTERQREALAATLTHRFVLYGGRAGGGKSYWLRWWCLRELLRLFGNTGIRGIRVGLFSIDYPTLTDRQISRIGLEFPAYLGRLRQTREDGYNFKLAAKYGAGTIALRNLDDPSKYRSSEFADIAVEELTENQPEVFDLLRFRLRWPGIDNPCFVGATNPGGIGHGWVKRLWIDGARDGRRKDFPQELLPLFEQFCYVPAGADDNPHLPQQYRDDLQTLPEQMRKALADGDWDVFAGQYFTEWREEVHVVDAFELPWFWTVERVGDWGESKPCAYLWVATSPEGEKYVVGEVYGAGMSIKTQASEILAFEQGKNIKSFGVLDSACWDGTGRLKSIADQFADYGVRWLPSSKKNGRVARWQMIRRALQFERDVQGAVTKQPVLRVFRNCANLVRTLPNMVHDKHRVEDLDTGGEDHAVDALGYHFSGAIDAPETPEATMTEEDRAFLQAARKEARTGRYADV